MKILGTGLSGLVGSRIQELLKDKYQFEDLSLTAGVDITDSEKILSLITSSNASLVLHLAAKTDVDGCERDKNQGTEGEAWKINVLGTRNVVDACLRNQKKIIYFSTDFVFDGEKKEPYDENDKPNPINWYAQTKYEGEKLVNESLLSWVILRIAYPYRANFPKKDFVRVLIDKLRNGEKLRLVTDHIMTPAFIDDLSNVLDSIIRNKSTGVFHAVGGQSVSPFEAGNLIAEIFNFDKRLLEKATREDFFKDKAPRPFRLSLKNDKIQKLGVKMKSFEEGVLEVKKQLNL